MLNSAAMELDSAESLRMRLWGQRLATSGQGEARYRRREGWGAAGAQGDDTTPSVHASCPGDAIANRSTPARSGRPTVARGSEIHAGEFNPPAVHGPAVPSGAGAAMTIPHSSAHFTQGQREEGRPWSAIAPNPPLKLVPKPSEPHGAITAMAATGDFGDEDSDLDVDFGWIEVDDTRDRAPQDGARLDDVLDAAEAVAQLSQLLTDMADSVAEFNRQLSPDLDTFLDLGDATALGENGVLLAGVNLDGAALEGCDLSGERMQCVSLVAANLTAAILSQTNLEGATLTRACLTRAVALAATFEMAKMDEIQAQLIQGRGGNFNYAKLRRSRLDLGDFERGRFDFASLRGASAIEASFSAASMQYANLSGGRFIRTDFRGTDLRQANLTGADLRGARLGSADLGGATLTGTVLAGAKFSAQTLWPQDFDPIAAGAILEA
ncbi:MAG: pentapeptide repeat-containing protein [Cyanobacteria bacterium]|nr:pentapeptide repeat-containing protein [Cyanobacteriota bacterium]